MYPWKRVGCKKSDSNWLNYNSTVRVTKHSPNSIVKVLSILLIFAAVEGSKNNKSSRQGRRNLSDSDIMCVSNISLKTKKPVAVTWLRRHWCKGNLTRNHVEKMPDLASHHTITSTNGEPSSAVPFTTVVKFYLPPYIFCLHLYNRGAGLLLSRTQRWQGGDLFKILDKRMIKLTLTSMRSAIFFPHELIWSAGKVFRYL